MNPFEKLSKQEYELLLKFPVYISLLAVNFDGNIDETEKKTAIKFAHTKTFTSDPLLREFYNEADLVFEKNIVQLDNELPSEKETRKAAINKELLIIDKIVFKLGEDYVSKMHDSMNSFKEHVLKAHQNIVFDFMFPFPISGFIE
jgi:hypothetical protein